MGVLQNMCVHARVLPKQEPDGGNRRRERQEGEEEEEEACNDLVARA